MNIRNQTPDDYAAFVDIQNANFPDMPAIVEDYVEVDKNFRKDERSIFTRLVVEEDGQVVGYLQYFRPIWNFDPHNFDVTIRLHPDYQDKGIGTILAEKLEECLTPYKPQKIRASVREYHPHGLAFAQKYGFEAVHRNSESTLNLAEFDGSSYEDVAERMETAAIQIKSYNELAKQMDDIDQRLYALFQLIERDVPGDEPYEEPGFENWYNDYLTHARLNKDAFKIAVHDDQLVGVSNVFIDLASDMLYTDLTGVLREFRGKGIAVALKLAVIEWAIANGKSLIKTQNEVNNVGMLSINYRLGYKKQPGWIYLKKVVQS